MNTPTLAPRPTRSTLRNRRIVMDLKASINGSYVGENGLKGAARQDLKANTVNDRRELTTKAITAVLLIAFVLLLILGFKY